jgi:septal ring factor EnvC (AmiA/AmiB activator)
MTNNSNKTSMNIKNLAGLQKYAIPVLGVLFGLASLLILAQIVFSPKSSPNAEDIKGADTSEQINTTELRIQAIDKRLGEIEANIKKIYSNQVKLNESIGSLIQTDDGLKKTQKDNRAYIAMMYQRILDLELQVGNLGGGFNMKSKTREEAINPLIGTEDLPAVVPPNTGESLQ